MKKVLLFIVFSAIGAQAFCFENMVTVRAAVPEKLSFTYGMFFDLVPEPEKADPSDDFHPMVYNQYSSGILLEFETGPCGGKINFGGFSYIICGGSIKASVFRTWGDPVYIDPGQLYAGMELDFRFYPYIVSAGVYRHIHGDSPDPLTISTLGVGLFFSI
jgi:hypothetical protein